MTTSQDVLDAISAWLNAKSKQQVGKKIETIGMFAGFMADMNEELHETSVEVSQTLQNANATLEAFVSERVEQEVNKLLGSVRKFSQKSVGSIDLYPERQGR